MATIRPRVSRLIQMGWEEISRSLLCRHPEAQQRPGRDMVETLEVHPGAWNIARLSAPGKVRAINIM